MGRVGPAALGLEQALAPLAPNYDLIVLDCPPGEALVHTAAMTAAHHVLIPTQPDNASIDGLGRVFSQYLEVRASTNPDVRILGVVLGPSRGPRRDSTRRRASVGALPWWRRATAEGRDGLAVPSGSLSASTDARDQANG